jgi:hypothetical protein
MIFSHPASFVEVGVDGGLLTLKFASEQVIEVASLSMVPRLGVLCAVDGLEELIEAVNWLPVSSSNLLGRPAPRRFKTGNFCFFLPSPKYSLSICAPEGRRSSLSGVLARSPRNARTSPGVRGVVGVGGP